MRAKKKTQTVPVRLEVSTEGAAAEEQTFSGVPLFEQPSGENAERIDRIAVIRTEPLDEGFVGYLEPTASEEEIAAKFGGGTFRLQCRTHYGKPISGGFRTVKLAGEPKFGSALSLARWNRMKRQERAIDQGEDPEAPRKEPSKLELWEMQERRDEARRLRDKEEYDRRELEREAAHKRELERLRIEAEARERERRADDERRERDRQAAEERRERDRRAEEDRRAADQEQQRTRDREFYANMLALQKDSAKSGGMSQTLELLATAKELFGGGDGGGDPVTALLQNLPAILDKGGAIATTISEAQPAAAAKPGIKLTGLHAQMLQQLLEKWQAEGYDPNRTLLRALAALRKIQPQPGAQPAPEAAQGGGSEQSAQASEPGPAAKARRPAHPRGRGRR